MPADLIEQLAGAARVLDRLAPPVTLDELTTAEQREADRSSVASARVPLDQAVGRSSTRRSLQPVAAVAAALVVTVGGLAALGSRNTADPADPAASGPAPAETVGTVQPSVLDPITSGAIATDLSDGALPDDLVVRFGAELADASQIWVYDSASTDQVCFVRVAGDTQSAGCVDPTTYQTGITWSLEGTGTAALLWGLTPPSIPVTVMIGDRTIESDSNGLWYTAVPADATSFTITTPTGATTVPIVTTPVATTTTDATQESATARPAPDGAMVLDQFPAVLTGATGYSYAATAAASEPSFPANTWIQRWYTATMDQPELHPRLKVASTSSTKQFPSVGADARQVTVRGATAWLYDEPEDGGRTVAFQVGETVFVVTGYQLSDEELLTAAEHTMPADSSVGSVIDADALPAGLAERAVGITPEGSFVPLESPPQPVASVRWYNARPDGALPGSGEPMLWLGWSIDDPDLASLRRLDYDKVTDTTVRGVPAFVATNESPTYLGVIWSEGGYTYTLGGWGLDQDTLVAAADQLRPATDADWSALQPEPG